MKIHYFLFVVIMIVFTGCGGVSTDTVQQIESEYENIKEKVEDGELSEQDIAAEYCKLFENIAKGDKTKASEYADLLRKITEDEFDFEDEDVFSVAESCAMFFKKMTEGYDDFGLQDIVVSRGKNGKYIVRFEYFGEVRAYSVDQVNNGEQVKVTFYDAKPSEALLDKYPFVEEHQVDGLTLKVEYTADHGFVVYISGTSVLDVEEKATTTVDRPEGTIEIEL